MFSPTSIITTMTLFSLLLVNRLCWIWIQYHKQNKSIISFVTTWAKSYTKPLFWAGSPDQQWWPAMVQKECHQAAEEPFQHGVGVHVYPVRAPHVWRFSCSWHGSKSLWTGREFKDSTYFMNFLKLRRLWHLVWHSYISITRRVILTVSLETHVFGMEFHPTFDSLSC